MNTPQEFAILAAALRELPPEGVALATLTHTHGSTFRRAGARMLVYADGRLVRGLSGGCPERDIAAHGRQVIASGLARRVRYDRQQNFDAMIEMGCGGELEVLIEPLRNPRDCAFAVEIGRCVQARKNGVLATAYAREGECLPVPQRLLSSAASHYDDIADPALAEAIRAHIAKLGESFKPQVETIEGYEVLFELMQPPMAAYIVGFNASSQALASVLGRMGWQVTLIEQEQLPPATGMDSAIACANLSPTALAAWGERFDARSFAIVMTHNLERDIEYLRQLAPMPLRYLGAIGARQRVERMRAALGDIAVPLYAPAGLDIGSETPEEIALAIAAEMLAVANGHEGGFLSRTHTAIHH